jgi:hypothetical protein
MSPTLQNSDYILAFKLPNTCFRTDDIIIVKHPQFSEIIKRVQRVDSKGVLWLVGDGTDTLSTEKIGPIHPSWILAKMFWRIKA